MLKGRRPNPLANDNITLNPLQGHAGVVIECQTCHDSTSIAFAAGARIGCAHCHKKPTLKR
jgi:hypothetical protein